MKEFTCAFTGHRPKSFPWRYDESDPDCVLLKEVLSEQIKALADRGVTDFLSGMAQGTDLYFCEAAQALRDDRPGVTVEAAIPCEEQAAKWPEQDRERYFRLVELCDFETVVQRHYDRGCMLRRNRYMVDRSSLLIAAFDGTLGGTMYTVTYAMKKGVEIVTIEL